MTMHKHSAIAETNLIVEVSPGKTPALVGVEPGGVLEFRNCYLDLPDFEIVFGETGPPNPEDRLTGTITEPVFVHMPNADLTVEYYVVYYKKKGVHHSKLAEGPHKAHSCPGCGQ